MVIIASIYFSDLARKKVIELPILPETMPELSKSSKNEEFETFNNGMFNLLGTVGLVTFSIESFLPEYADKYKWAKSQIDPYTLINLWSLAETNKTPIRCVMQRNSNNKNPEILNWMVSVESMTWFERGNSDIKYTVSFKEYRVIK